MRGQVRIGTSGFVYKHWRGRFYPSDLPATRWLEHYASYFDTVELNNTFYRQPSLAQFTRWRSAVPDGFAYAVKLNRFLTHMKRLDVDAATIARSYDAVAGLGPKLAAVLVQLPPRLRFDPGRLAGFMRAVARRRRRRHAIEPRPVVAHGRRTRRATPSSCRALPYRHPAVADARRRDRGLRLPALPRPRTPLRRDV